MTKKKRKPKISKLDATQILKTHIENMDLKGWAYQLDTIEKDYENNWSAVFDVYSPEGTLFDEPIIFKVVGETGEVRTLDEHIIAIH